MDREAERKRRKRLAALPFSEKLKILEKLGERDRAIAAAGLRKRRSEKASLPADRTTGLPVLSTGNGAPSLTSKQVREILFKFP